MISEKFGVVVKAEVSTEDLVIFADDGMNPIRIPLTLEDAEKFNAELTKLIENEKRKRDLNV